MDWKKRKKLRKIAKKHGFNHYYEYKRFLKLREELKYYDFVRLEQEFARTVVMDKLANIIERQIIELVPKDKVDKEIAETSDFEYKEFLQKLKMLMGDDSDGN